MKAMALRRPGTQTKEPGAAQAGATLVSIGGLARATGVPVETLRTWELRYGFPKSIRKPSGHRRFDVGDVVRIRRIVVALGRGLRAGEVVPASDQALKELISTVPPAATRRGPASPIEPPALLEMVLDFDTDRLMRFLRSDLAYEDPIAYIETRISPCLKIIGSAWSEGSLDVAHEHFASERISDVLREVRLRFEETATGPAVVLATLPGEAHGLGLQITALILTSRGLRVLGLGTEVPIADLVALVERTGAVAVGMSVSAASEGKAKAPLARLRTRLPRRVQMIVGGAGAPAGLTGVRALADLEDLKSWADELRKA